MVSWRVAEWVRNGVSALLPLALRLPIGMPVRSGGGLIKLRSTRSVPRFQPRGPAASLPPRVDEATLAIHRTIGNGQHCVGASVRSSEAQLFYVSNARATAALRVSTPSFARMLWTCLWTVRWLDPRIVAISRSRLPWASQ